MRQVETAGPSGGFAAVSEAGAVGLIRQIHLVSSGAAANMMTKATMTPRSARGMPVTMTMVVAPLVSAPGLVIEMILEAVRADVTL